MHGVVGCGGFFPLLELELRFYAAKRLDQARPVEQSTELGGKSFVKIDCQEPAAAVDRHALPSTPPMQCRGNPPAPGAHHRDSLQYRTSVC